MPRRPRRCRGIYTRLSKDKLNDIYRTLSENSDMTVPQLMRQYHLKRRTAYQLHADFSQCTSPEGFHQTELRGRRRKNFDLLHSKIERILRADSGLNLKAVCRRLKR
eukprot:EG_transcript_60098